VHLYKPLSPLYLCKHSRSWLCWKSSRRESLKSVQIRLGYFPENVTAWGSVWVSSCLSDSEFSHTSVAFLNVFISWSLGESNFILFLI
jgi:hypothetical protein